MHHTRRARHQKTPAQHWLRRAFLTVGMAGALTGTFALTTVSPASASDGSIDAIEQVVVTWVATNVDGIVITGSSTEYVTGGSGADVPVPIDLGVYAGPKCRAGDGWDVKSSLEGRTRFYTAYKYHTDFTYIYDCKNVTNVYNFKVYPSSVAGWQGWEFQGHETPPTGVSTYPKPTVSIIGQGKFAQCLPSPIGQYCANQHVVTITWNAFGSGARPKGQAQSS